MEINTRNPDRLSVSTKANELISHIDESNYLGLGKSSINRSELFLFAMALGAETGMETQIVNPYAGGLILEKSIDNKTRSILYAQHLASFSDPDNDLDNIIDKVRTYKMAEQFANTGFEIIEDYINNKRENDLIYDIFLEVDDQFASLNISQNDNTSDM